MNQTITNAPADEAPVLGRRLAAVAATSFLAVGMTLVAISPASAQESSSTTEADTSSTTEDDTSSTTAADTSSTTAAETSTTADSDTGSAPSGGAATGAGGTASTGDNSNALLVSGLGAAVAAAAVRGAVVTRRRQPHQS